MTCHLYSSSPLADRDNGVEIVESDGSSLSFSLNRPMPSGMFQNGTNHFFFQLSGLEDVFQVLANGWTLYSEKFGDLILSQPDGFVVQNALHLYLAIRRGVEQKIGQLFPHGRPAVFCFQRNCYFHLSSGFCGSPFYSRLFMASVLHDFNTLIYVYILLTDGFPSTEVICSMAILFHFWGDREKRYSPTPA